LKAFSPCGAQAGGLVGGRQLSAASAAGRVEEVRRLIAARANIEESDRVRDPGLRHHHTYLTECIY